MSNQEKDNFYYDNVYQTNKAYLKKAEEMLYFPIWKRAIQMMDENSIIAEFGCGPGQFAELVINHGLKYAFGVDFSQNAIRMVKERTGKDYFYVGNLYNKRNYTIKEYNTAILLEVLEHIEEDLKVLSYLPEGVRVIFSVPNFNETSHVRTYSLESIKERYENLLDIIEIIPFKIKENAVIFLCDATKKEIPMIQ
ncbi:MAG: hypothetical protein CVV02_02940 [Firmicutes bacterium HGW-Firmicutes-7]|nr:MAG: hypothetical protein CVV02_02940 [Firmicutes bacterium HGW-Firmicutes-7]